MGAFIYPVVTEKTKKLPYYLIGVGCDWEQEFIDRPFGYPTHQWVHCVSGTGRVTIQGKEEQMVPGQGMMLTPGVPHSYGALQEPWIVHWFTFSGSQIDSLLQCIELNESKIYWCNDGGAVSGTIRQAFAVLSHDESPSAGFKCSALVYSILMQLFSFVTVSTADTSYEKHNKLQPVFTYIREHYHKPLTISDLADTIQVTPQYLCILFKELVHCRPFEYLTQYRISRSKQLLIAEPYTKIADIARTVGYDNESYFATIFRKLEGVSPSVYRRLHGIDHPR